MKKFIAFLLAGTMILAMAGCGNSTAEVSTTEDGLYEFKLEGSEYIELGEYKGLTVEKAMSKVTDAEVEESIAMLAEDSIEYVDVKDRKEIQDDDYVTANIDCSIEGKHNDDYSDEGVEFQIGSGDYDFGDGCNLEAALIGAEIGKTVKVEGTFGDDFYDEDVAGKKASFTIKVTSIQEEVMPAIDDDFVRKNTEYKSLEECREATRKDLEENYDYDNQQDMYNDLINMIMDNCTQKKEFPKDLIDKEVKNLEASNEEWASYFGMTAEEYIEEYYGMSLEEYAQYSMKNDCVMQLLKKEENISISDEEFDQLLDQYMQDYGFENKESVFAENSKESLLEEFEYNKLMEKLVSYSKVVEVEPSVEEEVED